MAENFQPDERIERVEVVVHTADKSSAGTNCDVWLELFDWPEGTPKSLEENFHCATPLDNGGYDDFERGATDNYALPRSYFEGRVVNDIVRVRLIKSKGSGIFSGWDLGWVTIKVNGKDLASNHTTVVTEVCHTFTDDSLVWTMPAPFFERVEFTAPALTDAGLPDAGPNQDYLVTLTARGGRKPLTWTLLTPSGAAFIAPPTLELLDAAGTRARLSARTAKTHASWKATLRITDQDGRSSDTPLKMSVIDTLPPPSILSFTPTFGWPALDPAAPEATRVTLTGTNFDSRGGPQGGATRVFFDSADNTGMIEAKILDLTSTTSVVEVPKNAGKGKLLVKTEFGKDDDAGFVAHPNGYRFRSGFRFRNDDASFGGDWYPLERYEDAFGVGEIWLNVFGQTTIPYPHVGIIYLATAWMNTNGNCHGMSLTSLQMKEGLLAATAYASQRSEPPLDDALWDLETPEEGATKLRDACQSRQLVMLSDEALAFFFHRFADIPSVDGDLCLMDARPTLLDMKSALADRLDDPRLLAFAKNCSPFAAHVVVPYEVAPDPLHPGHELIHVWDPNKPAKAGDPSDKDSAFKVDPKTGVWSYNFSDGTPWSGLYMFTIPFSAYGRQQDWSLPGLGALFGLLDIILGMASVGGGAEIRQVSDEAGHALIGHDGAVVKDRSRWPPGARPIPFTGGNQSRLLALAKGPPVRFDVEPPHTLVQLGARRARVAPRYTGFFAITRGGEVSLSVEEIAVRVSLRFDPDGDVLHISSDTEPAAILVRVGRRLSSAECLSYALRIHGLAPGETIRVRPVASGRAVRLDADRASLAMDVEVTHVSVIGQQRVLEAGGVVVPGRAAATFELTNPLDLDRKGATPLRFTLHAGEQRGLGHSPAGPFVIAPPRVVAEPANPSLSAVAPVGRRRVEIDVSRSLPAPDGSPLRFRALHGPEIVSAEGGRLAFELPPGTHPIFLVAEDDHGRRSFPRLVFATVPEPGRPLRPRVVVFGEDAVARPGAMVEFAIGTFTGDLPIHGVDIDFSVGDRLGGLGDEAVQFERAAFALSDELKALGASARVTASRGGLDLRATITWPAALARAGRIELGRFRVSVPVGVALGSTFALAGRGEVAAAAGPEAVSVLPSEIRIWGGPEADSIALPRGLEVAEGGESILRLKAAGLPAGARNVGFRVESAGGRATIAQDAADPTRATLIGERAGVVKVHAVVGTRTATTVVRVRPSKSRAARSTPSTARLPRRMS